jgi:DNA-binding CsgD family transcriptional regulator
LATYLSELALDRVGKIADKGFRILLGLSRSHPHRYEANTLEKSWRDAYCAANLKDTDPSLNWSYGNTGEIRLSDIPKDEKSEDFYKIAKDNGLMNVTVIAFDHRGERVYVLAGHDVETLDDIALTEIKAALVVLAVLNPPERLSPPPLKELTYLRKASSGQSDQDIAEDLGITLRAVRERKKKVTEGLGANNIVQAIAIAKDAGIV